MAVVNVTPDSFADGGVRWDPDVAIADGTDLTKIVRERGPLPFAEACDYIRQAALGLQHAFEAGLVHRDIKPSNIIVSRDRRQVKLVDLGLARLIENEDAARGEGHRLRIGSGLRERLLAFLDGR